MGMPLGRAPISTMDLAEYMLTTKGDATRRVEKGELKDYLDSLDYCLDTGTANAYVITPTIPITAYEAGQTYKFKALNANTGASTINISGVGTKSLVKSGNVALAAGDIPKDAIVTTIYDGVNFQIVPDYSTQLSEKAKQADLNTTNTNLAQLSKPSSLINGDFQIWQRGTGFTINTASNTYTTDRWYATLGQITSGNLVIAKNTAQKENDTNCCVEINCASLVTTGSVILSQLLEDTEVIKLRGKKVTFSIYLKVLSGNANCKMQIQDGTNINTYPSTNPTVDEGTFNVTTTWQRFTLTHTVQANANSLVVRIFMPSAYTGVLYVSRAKLEIGDITPFVPRLLGEELALCQRYFESIMNGSDYYSTTAYNTSYFRLVFKATKRIPPAIKLWDTAGTQDKVSLSTFTANGMTPLGNVGLGFNYTDQAQFAVNGVNLVKGDTLTFQYQADSEIY